jgi:hypothetical protein
MSDSESITSIDQLPDDPMAMPPPYWRSSGAIFHIVDALEGVCMLLRQLLVVHARTEAELEAYFEKYPDETSFSSDIAEEEFSDIMDDLADLEHKIGMKVEVALLMSAIEVEDSLNQFMVFNLHKEVAETLEKLSPPEKLLMCANVVGGINIKSDIAYEAIKNLTKWRNSFAHGHCTDRPTQSLRHNHLIKPPEYPSPPTEIKTLRELIVSYLTVKKYLQQISKNPSTACSSVHDDEIRDSIDEISRYRFVGSEWTYQITYS